MKSLLGKRDSGETTLLVGLYVVLCFASLAILWSVTEGLRDPAYAALKPDVAKIVFWRQLIWIMLGTVALLVASRISLPMLSEGAPLFFAAAVLLLSIVLVVAPEVAGSRRWFSLGPMKLQPSEPAKVALILILARFFARTQADDHPVLPVAGSLLLTMIPVALILREPDLGTSLVYAAIWLGMVFWFGISWVNLLSAASPLFSALLSFYSERIAHSPWPWGVYLLLLLLVLYRTRSSVLGSILLLLVNIASGVGMTFFWEGLKPYQQDRILSFFQPEADKYKLATGYQAIQSKIAIGSGGLLGTQYLHGTQKGLSFLPERHTDFIFSVLGEEMGFIGAVGLLIVFLLIIIKGIDIAAEARKPFNSYLAIGVVTYFTFHVLVNISITTGLLPVTGLPLPFMSYGGSNFLVSSFMLGLLINIGSRSFES